MGIVFAGVPVAHAAIVNTQPIFTLLGQSDGDVTAPQPIYNKAAIHDTANKHGLSAPLIGMAFDVTYHRLFVSDTSNNRVLIYNLDGGNNLLDRIPDNVLGQINFYANAVATTQIGMSAPNGLAFDSTNNRLFVVDTTNNRVKVYDTTTIVDGMNANNVIGQATHIVATAATTQVGLNAPTDATLDGTATRLFVAQNTANRVTVFDVTDVADGEPAIKVLGQADFVTPTAATTQAGMNVPYGLAYDTATDRLFVSQGTGNRVTVYSGSTLLLSNGMAATKVIGQANFTATAVATSQTGMSGPRGLTYDESRGLLFVAETTNNRVLVFSGSVANLSNGMNATQVLGQLTFGTATAGSTQSGLNAPNGVVVDSANNKAYVMQSGAHRVSIFNLVLFNRGENAGDVLGQYDDTTGAPNPIFTKATANDGPSQYGLNVPQGIAVDPLNHRLLVADMTNNRVLIYNLDANNTPIDMFPDYVLGQPNFYTNTVGTTQAGMSAPAGVAVDLGRNLIFVSDMTNSRILVFNAAVLANGMNAANVLGQINFVTATAGTSQIGLSSPRQIEYDGSTKQLYVADTGNNRVLIYDLTIILDAKNAASVIGQTDGLASPVQPIFTKVAVNDGPTKLGLSAPTVGIVLDEVNHRLFVSDSGNNRVLVYNLDSNNILIDRMPDNVLGQTNYYTSAAVSTRAGTSGPAGLSLDRVNNRLFVAQTTGNRVSVFDVSSITDGEDATNVLGQVNYTTVTAVTSQVGMNVPTDVAYDPPTGRLFVPQTGGNRVTVYNLTGGLADNLNANNALGQNDTYMADPSPIYTKTAAHNGPNILGISAPVIGMALDSTGHRLFMSDTVNNRVLVYNLDGSNNLVDRIPDNVLGQLNFYSNAAANTQIGLSAPNGLAFDSTNNRLFVAEAGGNRVKVFFTSSITDGMNAINVLGQINFTGTTAATTQVGMNVPTGVAYDDATGRLFVAQITGNRVTVYSGSLLQLTNGMPATKILGQSSFTVTTAATTQVGMNIPYDVAFDADTSRIFVSQSTGNRVTVYSGSVANLTNGMNATKVLGQTNFTNTALGNTQVGMNAPRGIAYDGTRDLLYVAQATGNRVTVYSGSVANLSNGMNATQVLGQVNFTTITAGNTQAGVNTPTGVMIDEANNEAYILQSGSSRATMYDLSTFVRGENAVDAIGQYDDSTVAPLPVYTKTAANNGPNRFGLSAPVIGLALDPTDHRLFVSDTGNNRILVYQLDANDLLDDRIPDFVLGQSNFYSNAPATTQAGLNVPAGIAYDNATDRLFVAQNTANRVSVFSGSVAELTNGLNATKVLGQTSFTGGSPNTTQGGMNIPYGVAYDAATSRLFVSQGAGNRVTVYSGAVANLTNGMNATKVLGQVNYTATSVATTQVGMSGPRDLAYDTTRNWLYVADLTNNRVLVYSGSVANLTLGMNASQVLGQTVFTVATLGNTQAGMNAPTGLGYDNTNQRLFVAQTTGNRVTIYDLAAIVRGEPAINVLGQPNFTTITAGVFQEGLNAPTGVLTDPAHNRAYVLDSTTSRVLSYNLTLGIGNGKLANKVLGQTNFTNTAVGSTQSTLSSPYSVAYDYTTSRLFVSDLTNNRVLVYSGSVALLADGMNATKVIGQTTFIAVGAATTQAGLNVPRGIEYDETHSKLFVAQSTANRVSVFSGSVAQVTNGMNAIKVIGQPIFTTATAVTSQAGLNVPMGAYVDEESNRLYVTQSTGNRVSVFDIAAISDGEGAVNLLGQYDGLNPPGPAYLKATANNGINRTGISGPQGFVLDTTNNRLFVADSANNRILLYNLNDAHLPADFIADGVLGQPLYWLGGVNTTQAGLSLPAGLAYDPTGNTLFAADFTNNRIVAYDVNSVTDGENAIAVLGQQTFLSATAGTSQVGLTGPRQLTYDRTSGKLFVIDATNNRVPIYDVNHSGDNTTNKFFYFFGF